MGAGRKKSRKGRARLASMGAASLLVLSSFEPSARADITSVCGLQPQMATLYKVPDFTPKCTSLLANPNTQPLGESCQTCSAAVTKQQGQMKAAYTSACGESASADATGEAAAEAAKSADPQAQAVFETTQGTMASKAMEAVGIKASSATTFSAAAKDCAAELKSACSGASALNPDVKAAVTSAEAACNAMSAESTGLATVAGSGASTLGDMAQYAMGGAALLGAGMGLYSMLNKGGTSSGSYNYPNANQNGSADLTGTGTAPTPDSVNTSAKITDSTYTGGMNSSGASKTVAFDTSNLSKGTTGNSANGNPDGSAPAGSGGSRSSGSRGSGGLPAFGSFGKTPSLPGTYVPSNGGDSGAPVPDLGGTGASSAADFKKPEGGSAGNKDDATVPYELGGGGSRAILGMKAKGDINELDGALGPGTYLGKGLDLGEGDRSLASQGLRGEGSQDGASLFHMIRLRYVELKKSGHF